MAASVLTENLPCSAHVCFEAGSPCGSEHGHRLAAGEAGRKGRGLKIPLKMPIIPFSSRKPFLGVVISYLNAIFSYNFMYGFIEHNNMFLFKVSEAMSHFDGSDSLMGGVPAVRQCAVSCAGSVSWGTNEDPTVRGAR